MCSPLPWGGFTRRCCCSDAAPLPSPSWLCSLQPGARRRAAELGRCWVWAEGVRWACRARPCRVTTCPPTALPAFDAQPPLHRMMMHCCCTLTHAPGPCAAAVGRQLQKGVQPHLRLEPGTQPEPHLLQGGAHLCLEPVCGDLVPPRFLGWSSSLLHAAAGSVWHQFDNHMLRTGLILPGSPLVRSITTCLKRRRLRPAAGVSSRLAGAVLLLASSCAATLPSLPGTAR